MNFVSIIIPTYNEEKVIEKCLSSLKDQSYSPFEIIIVDDGSTDRTRAFAKKFEARLLKQNHQGPGVARNLGSANAKGEILVFVDADMTFSKDFIGDLIKPIIKGETIGTFSKNEMNANKENVWSQCWNINRGWPIEKLIPPDYPETAPVFRAILKKEFDKVGGFETSGQYTDDWSLSKKLGKKSTLAKEAVYYHSNPSSPPEVFKQARWIGKSEFISGSLIRRFRSVAFYSLPMSLIFGVFKSITNRKPKFLIFKIIYDFAIWVSTIKSFFGTKKFK